MRARERTGERASERSRKERERTREKTKGNKKRDINSISSKNSSWSSGGSCIGNNNCDDDA